MAPIPRPAVRPPRPHPSGARPPAIASQELPRHVAIVMDGNGRWARERGLKRTEGHARGEESLFDVIEGAIELGIPYLSAYAFSTENWKRSPDEVRWLMGFNRDVIHRRRDELDAMGVRIRWAGRRPRLWGSVIRELEQAEEQSRDNSTLTLQFCVNYGGRAEIVDAARRVAELAAQGETRSPPTHRGPLSPVPRRAGDPRRRPVHPILRRAADLQLPHLANGVRRNGVPRQAVAGLRPPRPVGCGRDVRQQGPSLRRRRPEPGRTGYELTCGWRLTPL